MSSENKLVPPVGLHHLVLNVRSLAESHRFWTEVVGFKQVGELKASHNLPPADPAREADQIARLRRLAADARLDPAFAEKFLNFIIDEVVRHHRAIAARPRQDGAAAS